MLSKNVSFIEIHRKCFCLFCLIRVNVTCRAKKFWQSWQKSYVLMYISFFNFAFLFFKFFISFSNTNIVWISLFEFNIIMIVVIIINVAQLKLNQYENQQTHHCSLNQFLNSILRIQFAILFTFFKTSFEQIKRLLNIFFNNFTLTTFLNDTYSKRDIFKIVALKNFNSNQKLILNISFSRLKLLSTFLRTKLNFDFDVVVFFFSIRRENARVANFDRVVSIDEFRHESIARRSKSEFSFVRLHFLYRELDQQQWLRCLSWLRHICHHFSKFNCVHRAENRNVFKNLNFCVFERHRRDLRLMCRYFFWKWNQNRSTSRTLRVRCT